MNVKDRVHNWTNGYSTPQSGDGMGGEHRAVVFLHFVEFKPVFVSVTFIVFLLIY